jgi:hypothetical protein
MNSLLRSACVITFLAAASLVHAADAAKIVETIPTEVTEVVSGGSWSEGDTSGEFRAITVTEQVGSTTQASVIVQMLAIDKASSTRKVIKTVPLKEVNDKKLESAFLTMNVESDNELTLNITSYDTEKDQDTELTVKFASTGKYEIVATPKDEGAAASQDDVKKAK